jgi:hypothetical protein
MPRLRTDKQLGAGVLEPENQMRDVELPEQGLIGECCVESNELKKATIWTTI